MSNNALSSDEVLIQAKALVKRYGDFTAVDGIDFQVRKGVDHDADHRGDLDPDQRGDHHLGEGSREVRTGN
jgi:hypothetical protein